MKLYRSFTVYSSPSWIWMLSINCMLKSFTMNDKTTQKWAWISILKPAESDGQWTTCWLKSVCACCHCDTCANWWRCAADAGDALQKETTPTQQPHSTSDILSGRHSGQRTWDVVYSTQGSFWKLALWPRGKANTAACLCPHWYRSFPVVIAAVFNRTWLRYVRVFAVAIPSVVCLSVTLVHPTQGVEPFGNISSLLCTLAILWPPCKILLRLSQGNPSVGGR